MHDTNWDKVNRAHDALCEFIHEAREMIRYYVEDGNLTIDELGQTHEIEPRDLRVLFTNLVEEQFHDEIFNLPNRG